MGYAELRSWKRWQQFYAELLRRCDEFSDDEIEARIRDFCREELMEREVFDGYAEETEIGNRALPPLPLRLVKRSRR